MFSAFANLPGPIKGATVLGVGVGGGAAFMGARANASPFWWWLAGGILLVFVLVALYVLFLKFRDKAKSGPFASLLAKAGGGRASIDPAQKARMDDLRKRFEEGVSTFKAAGKDLYSLPWFLLVGPSGSGKTEAMRHCNVGFPPGLQDCLQGSGGTMNMHWWFTNHAVVLDTAGRMFMEESQDGHATEWKEFMKLLKDCRPNAPINGMLLVISAESLLKDSAEKIEQTAGAIARQLDVVQRTLEVRFPVFVVVTKCDKIIGFRDFFETVNDPNLQHQILGWSNPAPLDEAFRPDQVDKHLDGVRQKLLARRLGLLQNPVHTLDPSARRADQVDEMFELPDNLVRIAPRLRRYLELIFVAGEWSPKPLFLRGIYFTSSMREGQALDVGLAEALGLDVDQIPGGKEWDKDKAYFLRDVFMSKVFKERGLVTRAANVSKAIARQRRMVVGVSAAAVLVLAGVAAFGFFSFSSSLKKPSEHWSVASTLFVEAGRDNPGGLDIRFIDPAKLSFRANAKLSPQPDGASFESPLEFVRASAAELKEPFNPPWIAAPAIGWKSEWSQKRAGAHRAIVERAVVVPLVDACRKKLRDEKEWGPEAVGALTQLVRIQTYAIGATPSAPEQKPTAVDVDVMFRYVLNKDDLGLYEGSRKDILDSVAAAYPTPWSAKEPPAPAFQALEVYATGTVKDAVKRLAQHAEQLENDRDMKPLADLKNAMVALSSEHTNLQSMEVFRAPEGVPQTLKQYESFESLFLARAEKIALARGEIDAQLKRLGDKDAATLVTDTGAMLQTRFAEYFSALLGQLPLPTEEGKGEKMDDRLAELRSELEASSRRVGETITRKIADMRAAVENVKWLLTQGGTTAGASRAYAAIARGYEQAAAELRGASESAAAEDIADAADAHITLVDQIGEVNEGARKLRTDLDLLAAWAPEGRAASDVLTRTRNEAVACLRTTVTIATSRRVHELVKRSVARWPGDADGVRTLVEDMTNARLADGTADRRINLKRPTIPLTAMEKDSEFARVYHWEGAGQVLKDWAEIRAFVEGTDKRVMLGRDDLRNDPASKYLAKANATSDYLRDYVAYWRKQAEEDSRPVAANWRAFGAAFSGPSFFDRLTEKLESLEKTVREALRVAPPDMSRAALAELDTGYRQLADAKFLRRAKLVCDRWATLAENDADAARRELLSSLEQGLIADDYLGVYAQDGLKYMNEFILTALNSLTRETRQGLEGARDKLLNDAKAVPLAYVQECDPMKTKPLTADQVKEIGAAAELLAQAGSNQRAGNLSKVPEELREVVSNLTGSKLIPAGSAAWFANLRGMTNALTQQKELSFTVTFWDKNDVPTRAGLSEDARGSAYGYACLMVGGKQVGEYFSLTVPTEAQKLAKLMVKLPLPDGQATELWVYSKLPEAGQAPANKFIVQGNWSLLQWMMSGCAEAKQDDADPLSWRVLLTFENDPKKYLWVKLTFNQKYPDRNSWPAVDRWP